MAKKKQKSPGATPVADVAAEKVPDVTASPSTSKPKKEKSAKKAAALKNDSMEVDEHMDGDVSGDANESVPEWPKEDDKELFALIRKSLPKNDTMNYASRVNYIPWEKVQFKDYSADECKKRWLFVLTRLRHYRIMAEVLDEAVQWVDQPWTNFNKGSKNQKHPDLPKKPLSSYMLFFMDIKDEIAKKNPDLAMTDLTKVIAEQYRNLDTKKKAQYVEKAKKAKEEYAKMSKKFIEDHPEVDAAKLGLLKALPPKAPTPFKLYSDSRVNKLVAEGKTKVEAREVCREEYKDLSEKQKVKWILLSLKAENAYDAEYEKFKQNNPGADIPAKKSLLTKEEITIKNSHVDGIPQKPPNSGYAIFSKKLFAGNALKDFEGKALLPEVSRRWKELSDGERAVYTQEATKLNEEYKVKYASYLEGLSPEKRALELASMMGLKRPKESQAGSQVPVKKAKKEAAPAVAKATPATPKAAAVKKTVKSKKNASPVKPTTPKATAKATPAKSQKSPTKAKASATPKSKVSPSKTATKGKGKASPAAASKTPKAKGGKAESTPAKGKSPAAQRTKKSLKNQTGTKKSKKVPVQVD